MRFVTDSIVKVAPLELIRYVHSGKPFNPSSNKDFPTKAVEVKRQNSWTQGDFAHNGYYAAKVLAIASKSDACLITFSYN